MGAGRRNAHRLPEKDIVKIFLRGLNPEVYSRAFETLVEVMDETRHELVDHRDIIEISERIKRPEPKRDAKDKSADAQVSRKGTYSKTPFGSLFVKDAKVSNLTKTVDLKDVECFKCHKK